jgi:hypothetical protein
MEKMQDLYFNISEENRKHINFSQLLLKEFPNLDQQFLTKEDNAIKSKMSSVSKTLTSIRKQLLELVRAC